SRRRNQPAAVMMPSRTNAIATASIRYPRASVMGPGSRGSQAGAARNVAREQSDDLGIPLRAGARLQRGDSFVQRHASPVRPVVDESVERIAHGDDARQSRDAAAGKPVGIPGAVEALV